MFPAKVWLYLLHPIWITLACVIVLLVLFRLTGLWRRYRLWIVGLLLAAYAIDTAIALPRLLYSYILSREPVVAQKISLPRELVLVNVGCEAKCHELLISGALEQVVVVQSQRSQPQEKALAFRYRPDWVIPGTCPDPRRRALGFGGIPLLKTGYCPQVNSVEVPVEGVFVVREHKNTLPAERATTFRPRDLVDGPPGRVIEFVGHEVQARTLAGKKVLASTYYHRAPGLLGLPPFVGCWHRPDNIIWIMPPGDTGCGFWRWFTWGGAEKAKGEPDWIYAEAFAPPDRPMAPPARAALPPPTPVEALEILANARSSLTVDDYLPGVRDVLFDASNSDRALSDLVVRLARRGNLEGALIVLVAANRPAALTDVAERLDPVPLVFNGSDLVVAEMQRNAGFRAAFADAMLVALAANWRPAESVERFLDLMEAEQSGWLCRQLGRFTGPRGILKARENRPGGIATVVMPPFVPQIVRRTAQACPAATAELLHEQMSSVYPATRTTAARLAVQSVPGFVSDLTAQAIVNIAEAKVHPREQRDHAEAHLALLRTAALSCDALANKVDSRIARQGPAPEALQRMLEKIRTGQAGEFCQG